MDDLVGRLRARAKQYRDAWGDSNPDLMSEEAAARIEKLEAQNARLREIVVAVPISEMVGRTVGRDKIRTYNEAKGLLLSVLNPNNAVLRT